MVRSSPTLAAMFITSVRELCLKLTGFAHLAEIRIINTAAFLMTNPFWAKKPGGSYVAKIGNRDIFATWKCLMDVTKLQEFGRKYTAAWCSQNAASVAAFFAEGASLKINKGLPAVGRKAIEAIAQDFMSAFPDMVVTMDGIDIERDQVKLWFSNGWRLPVPIHMGTTLKRGFKSCYTAFHKLYQ